MKRLTVYAHGIERNDERQLLQAGLRTLLKELNLDLVKIEFESKSVTIEVTP